MVLAKLRQWLFILRAALRNDRRYPRQTSTSVDFGDAQRGIGLCARRARGSRFVGIL
jgi:hypothetical protein